MPAIIDEGSKHCLELHRQFINPQLAKVLHYIGFDRRFVKAKGAYVWDDQGTKYLDCLGGYGVFNIGRNHPRVKQAIVDVLDADLANLIKMEAPLLSGLLARELIKLAPKGFSNVFFGNSGSDTVETSLKYARAATGRDKIIYCKGAFHGLTLGALSANGDANFREGFGDLLSDFVAVPFNDCEALERELAKGDAAAFIFECIQGKGVRPATDEFLQTAEVLCRQNGTLMIADEVQHGLGRTGKWFAFEHYNIEPDFILLSKSLSGGFVPVSAVLTRQAIYEKVFSTLERCVVHSSTFSQNNLAMAVGLATLQVIQDEKLVDNAANMGAKLQSRLKALQVQGELIKDVRGKGLMIGVEFHEPKSLRLKIAWKMLHNVNKGLFAQALVMQLLSKHQLITQVTGHQQEVIRLLPTLTINEDDLNWLTSALESVIDECHHFGGGLWKASKTLATLATRNMFKGN